MRTATQRSLLTTTLAVLALLMTYATPASAQDANFPPWPIITDGTVTLNGEPLTQGTLTARVRDWTSVSVPVVDGSFRCADPCLVIGPPTFDYIGSEITFHLVGVERPAKLKFEFPELIEPDRQNLTLEFSTGLGVALWIVVLAGGAAVALGGGVVLLMFRRGSPPNQA
jgi:hypothetical protein